VIEWWIVSFSLILARVGTFVAALPFLGGRLVPRSIKVGLTVSLSSMWFFSHGYASINSPLLPAEGIHWLAFGVALARESLLGAVLGYAFSLFLVPARVAGEFIGQELGLSLANLTDPSGENSATLVGQLFEMVGVLVLFGFDGHHVWLASLHATFGRWPIGGPIEPLPVVPLVSGLAAAHEWGLLLAAPVAICTFITSMVLAFMARTAPQLNLFSIGFALRLGVGLVAALLFLPDFVTSFAAVVGRFSDFLRRLI
jgi:flagellar biosynthetic protein FliR